jgi:signal transduction histidine kinase
MNDVLSNLSGQRQNAAIDRDRVESGQPAVVNSAALQDLVHDLRQPLGVIETLAYYLELTASDDRMCVHLKRIRAMVAQANGILERTIACPECLALEACPF